VNNKRANTARDKEAGLIRPSPVGLLAPLGGDGGDKPEDETENVD